MGYMTRKYECFDFIVQPVEKLTLSGKRYVGHRRGGGTETQVLGDNLVVSASVLNYLLTARF